MRELGRLWLYRHSVLNNRDFGRVHQFYIKRLLARHIIFD